MGYDIFTSQPDPVLAEKFARKYGYAYLFKPLDGTNVSTVQTLEGEIPIDQLLHRVGIPVGSKFDGDPKVYFRANIWGMQEVRKYFVELFNTIPEDERKIVGEKYISFIDAISYNDGKHVKTQDILTILQLIQYYGQDIGQTPLVDEFIEYMEIASTLDGFHVW